MSLYKGSKRYSITTNRPGNITPLTVEKDGIYNAPLGVSGFNPVTVKSNDLAIAMGSHIGSDGKWHKPPEWDDIESIDLTDKHEVYFLCACHRTAHDWFRIRFYGGGTLSWSYGHVSNGVYTIHQNSSETTVSSGDYISLFLGSIADDYVVVRIKATSYISSCSYQNWAATADLNCAMPMRYQSVLMRYGRMPKGTTLAGSSTYCLESDNIIDFAKDYWNTTTGVAVNGAYSSSWSLQRWRCDGWDLAKNKVTSYANMFDYCYCLCDVPNPLNMDGWVTSNTTSTAAMFRYCRSLNTCMSVRNWNLTNVTSLGSTFEQCRSVKYIDGIETWNAAPKCTNASYIFDWCCSMRNNIDLSNLYLGNGTVNFTNISYAFQCCFSVKKVNISNTNLSKCTSIACMGDGLFSCKELIMNNITPITSVCTNSNYFLDWTNVGEELVFDGWDFSGHRANFFIIGFQYSLGLKKLVFRNCTAPSGEGVTINDSTAAVSFRYCYNLEYLDASFIDMSVFTNTKTHSESFRDNYNLVEFYPPKNISKSFSLANNYNLNHDSLIRVINNLVTLEEDTTATLTIGSYNISKLTDPEKAVATNKGWTLA